jgi:3-vinyl bacteriochlorophyllide hydratase
MYTSEQLARRNATPWTRVQFILAPIQVIVFLISFSLVVRYLLSGEGYLVATVSVWIKIALLWALTITGMFWEKDVYGHWFMAKEFFWEDLGNLIAMLTHNAYFVVAYFSDNPQLIMTVMLFAYVTYLLNAGQFVVKGVNSARQRKAVQLELSREANLQTEL